MAQHALTKQSPSKYVLPHHRDATTRNDRINLSTNHE